MKFLNELAGSNDRNFKFTALVLLICLGRFAVLITRGQRHENPSMPITLLDIILIGVMLISALLAMIRGFVREILSIAAWAIAAVVTLYSFTKLLPLA